MTPRRYRMTRRSEAIEQTRSRIVTSAVALHSRQGIAATTWEDIAREAGVDRATVYRHFRGLDELVPACARLAFEAIDLPSRSEIEASLADLDDPRDRLERIVHDSCDCYARGADWLRTARREADLIPAIAEVATRIRVGVATLVNVALAGRPLDRARRLLLDVLIDYPFWQELIDSGVAPEDAPASITRLVDCLLADGGTDVRS
jgi:AcrR family transcriptional regulator